MKYCKTCDIHYDTPLEHCMFCHGDLEGDNQSVKYKFSPVTKTKKPSIWFRLFLLLNIASILITLGLDISDGMPITWAYTVGAANIFSIMFLYMFFSHTIWSAKLSKLIITTVLGIFLIGLSLNSYDWALDYVFPFVILGQLIILSSVILFHRKSWLDVSMNLLIMSLIGLVPGLLALLNVLETNWPSIICLSYALMVLLGMILLPSKESREEFKSRFHI